MKRLRATEDGKYPTDLSIPFRSFIHAGNAGKDCKRTSPDHEAAGSDTRPTGPQIKALEEVYLTTTVNKTVLEQNAALVMSISAGFAPKISCAITAAASGRTSWSTGQEKLKYGSDSGMNAKSHIDDSYAAK